MNCRIESLVAELDLDEAGTMLLEIGTTGAQLSANCGGIILEGEIAQSTAAVIGADRHDLVAAVQLGLTQLLLKHRAGGEF